MEKFKVRRGVGDSYIEIQVCPLKELDLKSLHNSNELNLLIADRIVDPTLVGLMFGPLETDEVVIQCPRNMSWPQLLAGLGLFPTPAKAARSLRKINFPLEIHPGYHREIFSHPEFFSEEKETPLTVNLWKPMHGDW